MQRAFFDIKVTHLNAPSYRQKEPAIVYRLHEKDKKRKYNRRIIVIEQGHFTPLILSTSGGMGLECAIFVKHLAKKIAQKKNQDLSDVMRGSKDRDQICSAKGYPHSHQRNHQRKPLSEEDRGGC